MHIAAAITYNSLINRNREKNKLHLIYELYDADIKGLTMQGQRVFSILKPIIFDKIDDIIENLKNNNKKITKTIIVKQILNQADDLIFAMNLSPFKYDSSFTDDLTFILNTYIKKYIEAHLSNIKYQWIDEYNQSLVANKTVKVKAPRKKAYNHDLLRNLSIQYDINTRLNINTIKKEIINFLQSDNNNFNQYIINKYFSNDILKQKLQLDINQNRIDINSFNSKFEENYIADVQDTVANIMQQLKLNITNIIAKQIVPLIKNNINNILPRINTWIMAEFSSDLYKHSWQGFADERKEDAKPVFEFLGKNINYCNQLLKSLNINVDQIISHLPNKITWYDFIMQIYQTNHDAELELIVRKYLVNKNKSIHEKHGDNLATLHDEKGEDTDITFNPRYDQYRSGPIIVYRQFSRSGKFIKDHVLVGEEGSNHNSIREKYKEQLKSCEWSKDKTPVFMEAYRLGNIGFIYPDLGLYNGKISVDDMGKLIKQQAHLVKIYSLPPKPSGGKITRLAKLIK